eukprot:810364-Prorocentrum_minimum.AAC.1
MFFSKFRKSKAVFQNSNTDVTAGVCLRQCDSDGDSSGAGGRLEGAGGGGVHLRSEVQLRVA